jgi:hypothetical protein
MATRKTVASKSERFQSAKAPAMKRLHLSEAARRKIVDPEPGSALARARDYGIDLTIIARNLTLSPSELLENVVRAQSLVRMTREIRKGAGRE